MQPKAGRQDHFSDFFVRTWSKSSENREAGKEEHREGSPNRLTNPEGQGRQVKIQVNPEQVAGNQKRQGGYKYRLCRRHMATLTNWCRNNGSGIFEWLRRECGGGAQVIAAG